MIFLFSILRDFRGAASLYLNYTIMQLGGARHLLFEMPFLLFGPMVRMNRFTPVLMISLFGI